MSSRGEREDRYEKGIRFRSRVTIGLGFVVVGATLYSFLLHRTNLPPGRVITMVAGAFLGVVLIINGIRSPALARSELPLEFSAWTDRQQALLSIAYAGVCIGLALEHGGGWITWLNIIYAIVFIIFSALDFLRSKRRRI